MPHQSLTKRSEGLSRAEQGKGRGINLTGPCQAPSECSFKGKLLAVEFSAVASSEGSQKLHVLGQSRAAKVGWKWGWGSTEPQLRDLGHFGAPGCLLLLPQLSTLPSFAFIRSGSAGPTSRPRTKGSVGRAEGLSGESSPNFSSPPGLNRPGARGEGGGEARGALQFWERIRALRGYPEVNGSPERAHGGEKRGGERGAQLGNGHGSRKRGA